MIINKDILTVESGIICHQVNCRNKMGSGIALSIAKKWPNVEVEYHAMCKNTKPKDLLGEYLIVNVSPNLYVCNVFGQDTYGMNGQYTDYNAVASAFDALKFLKVEEEFFGLQWYAPWKMGCARGGGDWKIYKKIIENNIPDITYCKWKE